MKRKLQGIGILALFLCGAALHPIVMMGCSVQKDYVAADKLTYDAVAPEYRAYVEADPKLDADQKARRLRTIDSWKIRVGGNAP